MTAGGPGRYTPHGKMRFPARRRRLAALLSGCLLPSLILAMPDRASALPAGLSWLDALLWQEHYFWDALLHARSPAARQQADPRLLPVTRNIAQQAAQQAANLRQIQEYARAQADNLRFALSQRDPSSSLETIGANLRTLSDGTTQVRNNLYYLATRCRFASSQALPDPELTDASMALIAQVQSTQLQLNALYTDAAALQASLAAEQAWLRDESLRYEGDALYRSVLGVQDSVFSIHNSAYELVLRSK